MKKPTIKLAFVTLALMALTILAWVVLVSPPAIKLTVPARGISIEPASFLRSLFGTTSRILYRTPEINGDIALWQDFTSRPILVEALPHTNSFLCLYLWDGDLRLLRINPNNKYSQAEANQNDTSSKIICSSPWEIKNASIDEWRQMESYLAESSTSEWPLQFVHRFPLNSSRARQLAWIIQGVQIRENLMNEYGAVNWPMVATRRYPAPASDRTGFEQKNTNAPRGL